MAVQKNKFIAAGFALVGAVSLAAAVLPAIKGSVPQSHVPRRQRLLAHVQRCCLA